MESKCQGQDHVVSMESPVFGRKVISIDGVELKKVGTPISMWSNYRFEVAGRPAVIKFRAVKRTKGMSLFIDGDRQEPEPGGHMSDESVQILMLLIALLIGGMLAYAIFKAL